MYNKAMAQVPAARSLGERELSRLLEQGGCYFVHRDERLLGLGQVVGNRLTALVSCAPGQGRLVAETLLSLIQEDTAELLVAETNRRAVALYQKLGFAPVGVEETWWEICGSRNNLPHLPLASLRGWRREVRQFNVTSLNVYDRTGLAVCL